MKNYKAAMTVWPPITPNSFVTKWRRSLLTGIVVLREFKRLLRLRGVLLLAFHLGQESQHLTEWRGKEVSLDFFFCETEEIKSQLKSTGFEIEEVIERDPYPAEIEYQSRRAYIFARKDL